MAIIQMIVDFFLRIWEQAVLRFEIIDSPGGWITNCQNVKKRLLAIKPPVRYACLPDIRFLFEPIGLRSGF